MGRSRSIRFGWADVPPPPDLSDFDRDGSDEGSPLRPSAGGAGRESGSGSWWDLDDWGDD